MSFLSEHNIFRRVTVFVVKVVVAFILVTVLWVLALRWTPVLFTPLTVKRAIEFRNEKDYDSHLQWRSLEKISPEMAKAVIASEDNMFDLHSGFDWPAILNAIETNKKGKRLLGGSTISQQTAKNVFCLPSRTWTRKGFEVYFTFLIEHVWDKHRIMEVYLNVAEMGKGIFGVEAAARHYFDKSAKDLTRREACLIAACLPSPLKRDPSKPTDYLSRRANAIASLEGKLVYPSWVLQKELTPEQMTAEIESRQKRLEKFQSRQKEARRKVFHLPGPSK